QAWGVTRWVGGCGTGGPNYTKIQDAINAASSGDEVVICNGNYSESINISNKNNLTIRSFANDKSKVTIINDSNGKETITFSNWNNNIIIKSITIKKNAQGNKDVIRVISYIGALSILDGDIINENVRGNGLNIISSLNKLSIKNVKIQIPQNSLKVPFIMSGNINNGMILDNVSIYGGQNYATSLKNIHYGLKITGSDFKSLSGVYIDGEINGGLEIKNSNFFSGYDAVTVVQSINGGVNVDNINIKTDLGRGIVFNTITNGASMSNLNIKTNRDGITFQSIWGGLNITNSTINTKSKGIVFNNTTGSITLDNITINSYLQSVYFSKYWINPITVKNSNFTSENDDAFYLGTSDWITFTATGNIFKTNSTNYKYALKVDVITNPSSIKINNNCFFSASGVQYLAWSKEKGYDWTGNYWDGHSGNYTYNNINDNSPLPFCGGLPVCFTDNFNRSQLGSLWEIIRRRNFTPTVDGDKLYLTDRNNYIATGVTLKGKFPANNNYIEVEFDHFAYPNASGADGMTIVFSDASVQPVAGGYGASLGYANICGEAGFAGGWIGVGIDEWGNFSHYSFCHNGGQGFINDSVAVRGRGNGQTGYAYLTGTTTLNPEIDSNTNPGPGYKYKITLDTRDNRTLIKVERNTGSGYQTLINWRDITQNAQAPDNFRFSITGSTGSVTNFHKLDNLVIKARYCGDLGQVGGVNHYRIEHDGIGLTCQPENVTIKACVDDNCTQTYSSSAKVILNKDSSSIGNYTFTGSTTASVVQQTPATVTLSLTNMNPAPTSNYQYKCINTSSGVETCNITFYDSGFVFDIQNDYSCKEQDVVIKAVRKDDYTHKCVPAFQNKTLPISFSYGYIEPDVNPYNTKPLINGTALDSTINLNFNNNGESNFRIKYNDAGKILIKASFDNGTVKATGSDEATFRPYGFYVYTNTPNWEAENGADSSLFKKAGEEFNLKAKAVCWESDTDTDLSNNNLTPNFNNINADIYHELVAPSGGNYGNIGVGKFTFNYGESSIDNQTYSEVGIIKFNVVHNNYLGTGYNITGVSQNIGRFYPYKFGSSEYGTVINAVNNFTYFGQDNVTVSGFKFSALNKSGGVTKNYSGDFAKLNLNDNLSYHFTNTDNLQFIQNIISSAWVDGVANVTAKFIFDRPVTPIIPKFPIIQIKPVDSDGVTSDDKMSINDNNTIELRYGFFDIKDGYGPSNLPLTLQGYLLYYDNSSKWMLNSNDNVTVFNITDFTLSDWTGNLTPNSTNLESIYKNANGDYRLVLIAPGQNKNGSVKLNLNGFNYLQFNDSMFATPGTATFGIYNQKNKRLYWKEVPAK
ncbi:MAG: hypothetical protein K6348_02605, partial [Deferribacterales bacterium]